MSAVVVIKILFNSLLALLSVTGFFCAVFPKLGKQVAQWESNVRKSHPSLTRWLLGGAAALCVGYFATEVIAEVQRSKEQTSFYQHQLFLREEGLVLAKRLRGFADTWTRENAVTRESDFWFMVTDFTEKLARVGLDTKNLDRVSAEESAKVMDANSWQRIAEEIDKLAKQLPL